MADLCFLRNIIYSYRINYTALLFLFFRNKGPHLQKTDRLILYISGQRITIFLFFGRTNHQLYCSEHQLSI